jgi:hypothetical protein
VLFCASRPSAVIRDSETKELEQAMNVTLYRELVFEAACLALNSQWERQEIDGRNRKMHLKI